MVVALDLQGGDLNVTTLRGDNIAIPINFAAGTALDLSTHIVNCQVKHTSHYGPVEFDFNSIDGSVDMADAVNGNIKLIKSPSDTTSVFPFVGVWDLQLTDSSGNVKTYLTGTWTHVQDTTF